ncbi:hypothetical protein YC2023_049283 [Brassica napus]
MSKRFLPTTSVISTTESNYHRDEVLRRQLPEQRIYNIGVIIEEVNDEEEHHDDAEDGGNEQEANEETVQDDMEEEEKEDELWNGSGMRTMFTDEAITEEMYNPIDPFGIKTDREVGIKRKAWM